MSSIEALFVFELDDTHRGNRDDQGNNNKRKKCNGDNEFDQAGTGFHGLVMGLVEIKPAELIVMSASRSPRARVMVVGLVGNPVRGEKRIWESPSILLNRTPCLSFWGELPVMVKVLMSGVISKVTA